MKKIIIILSSVIIVLGAVLFGVYFYNTHPSDKYELDSFSFEVPMGFKKADHKDGYKYTFKCLGEEIDIECDHLNCKPEAAKDLMVYYNDDENVKLEKLKGYPYEGYFRTSERTIKDKKNALISCVLGTDTYYLFLDCTCSPLKAKILKPAIEKIAKTVKYTSDFRLEDKPEIYDYDFFTVSTGAKYACNDVTGELKSDSFLWVRETYTEADDVEKMYLPMTSIQVFDDGSSPAERADNLYNQKAEKENSYSVLTRDQKDMFGFKCEHIYYELNNESDDGDVRCLDNYYFSDDKYTYSIYVTYLKDADAADAKEMLDSITIKNK
ncbi:hypothetical protein [Ruminococcus sp.]|uniref:hypothetical protein n=1 Tax=Ruminococcus sp. TaxID=41978 RepID=UPI0025DC1552|nr:hypothetical protein [Ruminococcus sp.]